MHEMHTLWKVSFFFFSKMGCNTVVMEGTLQSKAILMCNAKISTFIGSNV